MALKSLIVMGMLLVCPYISRSCDACGCGVSNGSLGMLSSLQKNSVSLAWSYIPFSSVGSSLPLTDRFTRLELSCRYYISNRLKAIVFLPYQINKRDMGAETLSLMGISDTRVLLNYTLYQSNRDSVVNTYFEIGGGLSMPTGKYNPVLHRENLPENFNLGRGALGYLLQLNFLKSGNRFGLLAQSLAQVSGKSSGGYQFGRQMQGSSFLFYKLKLNNQVQLLPGIGFMAEWLSNDQYTNGNSVHGTGGRGFFPGVNISVRKKRWLLGFLAVHPLATTYSLGEVKALKRLSCQLSFIF